MAKLGSDWLYIGLGLGALYLIYKVSSPVTKVTDAIADTAVSAANGGVSYFTPSPVTDTISGTVAQSFTDLFTKSPIAQTQTAFDNLFNWAGKLGDFFGGSDNKNYSGGSVVSSGMPTFTSSTPVATSIFNTPITYGQATQQQTYQSPLAQRIVQGPMSVPSTSVKNIFGGYTQVATPVKR